MSKTSKRAIITIIIATFLVSMIPIMPVSAATLTVGPGKTYATITLALAAASDGDVIEVYAGTYTEDIVIQVDNIELVAAVTGVILKGVTSGDAPLATSNLFIDADGVSVHGFEIQTVTTTSGDPYATMVHVHGADAEIYDNDFVIASAVTTGEVVAIVSTQTVDVSGLNIHDNTFTATDNGNDWLEGIFINLNAGTGSVTIEDNTFSGALLRAIATEHDDTTITGNTLSSTLDADASFDQLTDAYAGIHVRGTGTGNVDIIDNDVSSFQSGIRLSGTTMSAIIITGNTLYDNYMSVYVTANADEVNVNYNDILDLVDNDDTTATLNAEYNWWGTIVEADIDTAAVGLIDFTPWLTELAGTPGEAFSIDFVTGGYVDYGDKLTVQGSGVTAGNTVKLYWDFATAGNELNTTTGKSSGDFECTVKVPSAYYGDHYIWAIDVASNTPTSYGPISVISKITLSPSSGLPKDTVTVKGYGFDVDSDIDIAFDDPSLSDDGGSDVDETDDLGYFEYTFKVEDDADYGTYDVIAEDADANTDSAEFTVGAAITIDKDVGPAGTIVKVSFRGFDPSTVINTEVDITLDGVPVSTRDGKNVTASTTGTGTVYVVIPSVETGEYEITIDDDTGNDASADFEVDGETSIKVTPEYGTPGMVLTVKGYNFTQVSGTEVALKLGERTAKAKTDSSGSFTASIVIPPSDLGDKYPVIANDTRLCHAEDDVLVTIIFLQLSDLSAPVGTSVTLMGSGFTDGGEWNATFGDLDLIATTGITGGQTYFSDTFHVPSLPSGTYPIGVYDVDREITVFIDFTITEQASLSVNRVEIPNGYNLTLKGVNFAESIEGEDAFETTWWIFNSTDAWDLSELPNVTTGTFPGGEVPVTSLEEDEEGTFTGYYIIPKFLELGSYTINCTTVSNAPSGEDWVINQTAEVDIKLVPEEVILNVGNPSYAKGQTITFVIKATLKKDFNLGIKDPEGGEVFNSTWLKAAWKTLGSWYYIPSNLQIDKNTDWLYTLPADAMPGTWTYSFWDDDKEYANGTFQVTQLTEIEQLQVDIGEIIAGIEGMGASNTGLAALVADLQGASAEAVAAAAAAAAAAGDAQTAAEAAMAAISDVDDTASDALDAANDAKSAADAAKTAADSGLAAANAAKATAQTAADAANDAADAAEGAKTAATGLTTLVYGAIGASLIAALAAIVSLMQISRRIAG